ncbi:MAG: pantoate--beta-alanine ligase [Chitinophagaceae bacterium]
MKIFTKVTELQSYLNPFISNSKSIGFAPTMGALHEGHLSLIEESKKSNELTVCSIFVNPTQFNDPKDFEKYPISIEQDIALLATKNCDVLFLPNVTEMYPNGTQKSKFYDLGFIETVLDGAYRPGHFQGVCQVVERLLEIVQPNNLYLGQKDYQQCMVIQKLIALMNWTNKINLKICATLREKDGLAMSSRNLRLSIDERKQANAIHKCFISIKEKIKKGELNDLLLINESFLIENGFRKIDYLTIAKADTLQSINNWDGQQKIVLLAAAFIGEVRLIDNMLLN